MGRNWKKFENPWLINLAIRNQHRLIYLIWIILLYGTNLFVFRLVNFIFFCLFLFHFFVCSLIFLSFWFSSLFSLLTCFYYLLAGPPGAAWDYFTIWLWKSPVQIDLRTLRALGWGEPTTNNFFMYKPTPRSNFCLLAPAQFSKHTPPLGRVDPVGPRFGWAPHK